MIFDVYEVDHRKTITKIVLISFGLIGILLVTLIALFAFLIAMSIICTIVFSFFVANMGAASRIYFRANMKRFYHNIFDWIINDKKEIKIIKLCVINKILLQQTEKFNESKSDDDPNYNGEW